MISTSKTINPLCFPLQGERLIEASAGTGKTYAITVFYLRFLLGLGNSSTFDRLLTVKEILVVTFTKAATEELFERIRKNIRGLRIACLNQFTDDPLYSHLLNEIDDKHRAAQWLLLAEQQMDEAAIFTIHGFCKKMLSLNSFESRTLFEEKFLEEESSLYYQACADFWRRHFYPLSREIAEIIYTKWKGPKDLLKDIEFYLQGEMPEIKSSASKDDTLTVRHQKIIALINEFKKKWLASYNEVEKTIHQSSIDRKKFNLRNQIKWIEEINRWAEEKTRNYEVPKVLEKFSQRFLSERTRSGGLIPKHPLFVEIEKFLSTPMTLNDLVIPNAIIEIRDIVAKEKRRLNKLGFDDILNYLDSSLSSNRGEKIASIIRNHFPVAMIDEFQDTDPKQYRIFRRIWVQHPNTVILFIGDPKQAIYSFRGADIFAYMKARTEIQSRYTLEVNWRSSPGMIESINTLFQRKKNPFIFQEIPFIPAKSSAKNASLRFELREKRMPSMKLWLMEGRRNYSADEYRSYMAKQCAAEIRNWISAGQKNEALLWSGEKSKPVEASDIAVLVRTHKEAMQIRNALTLLNIPSVYLSNHNNVFKTLEAKEMLWILQGVLSKKVENSIRCALTTSIVGLNTRELDSLNNSENIWETIIEEFNGYRERWHRYGVMAMLREMITNRRITKNLLETPEGKRRLTDILHIGELLQEEGSKLKNEHALVRWLAKHINEPSKNTANQQIRLEGDSSLVQIVTIHKSKGLEYPLVWLPFIANHSEKNEVFYHDRTSLRLVLDFNRSDESLALAKEEILSEDLRLLYVALTRSVWHCSLGIAPLGRNRCKKIGETTFHRSALGFLVQKGRTEDAAGLHKCLQSICNKNIELCITKDPENIPWKETEKPKKNLQARYVTRNMVDDYWRIASYSSLRQSKQKNITDLTQKINVNANNTEKNLQRSSLTIHKFPTGTRSGTFLHNLFETLDFTQPISEKWLLEKLKEAGYESHWKTAIATCITSVLSAPLIENTFSLNQLDNKKKLVEMGFFLSIKKTVTSEVLNKLIKKYDPVSGNRESLDFFHARGILKGFIDLVFYHRGKYYLLDYKSNWLGESIEDYNFQSILHTMQMHHYDLQYQFYTLALHRYLRCRITDYNYQTYFGNVIYIFLRGINANDPKFGIFTIRPDIELINELDDLFDNRMENMKC